MTSRPTRLLAGAALALAVLGPLLPSATAASGSPETTTLKPATLERGQNPAIPQLLGKTILDGGIRITIDANEVHLLGKSGDDYVVGTWSDGGARVERVSVDGDRDVLMGRIRGDLLLSQDGEQVIETVVPDESRTVVTVRDASTGARQARREFRGLVSVLDVDENRAVLGRWSPDRTLWWHIRTGETRRISDRAGYFADIRANRLATLTADPYTGGCSLVAALRAPRTTLWRSCKSSVLAASPDGRRLLTHPILMDGPLSKVAVHGDHGRLLAGYRTDGWFGRGSWESGRSLLIATYGSRKSAIVRCEPAACERASRRIDTP